MDGNSEFVLRWEINNATAVHAAGKAKSKVFHKGGFEWDIKMEQDEKLAKFIIGCSLNNKRYWKCEGSASLCIFRSDGTFWETAAEEEFLFSDNKVFWTPLFEDNLNFHWRYLTHKNVAVTGKVTVEFHIHVTNWDMGESEPCIFDVPNNKSNVILKIGERKLHLYKEYLAFHSPVFDTLFFGDFAEKGKDEVEMKDVVYEEFVDLLNVVFLQTHGITDRTVPHILKLADRFQMKHILGLVLYHLTQSKGFDIVQKMIMADQYRLDALRDRCLNSLKSFAEWSEKIKSHPEANFSDGMKLAIYDRIVKLKPQ